MAYMWQSPGNQIEKQPVVKVDYNLNSKNRLSATYNWQVVDARSRSSEQRRRALPGCAELSQVHVVPAALLRHAPLDAVREHGQRAERRDHSGGPRTSATTTSNGPQTFADSGRLRR